MPPPTGRGRSRGRGRSQNPPPQPGPAAAQQQQSAPPPQSQQQQQPPPQAAPRPQQPPPQHLQQQYAPQQQRMPPPQGAPPPQRAPVPQAAVAAAPRQPGMPPSVQQAAMAAAAEQGRAAGAPVPGTGRSSQRGGARGDHRPGGDGDLARQMQAMAVGGGDERKRRYVRYGSEIQEIPTRPESCVTKQGTDGLVINLQSNYFNLSQLPEYTLNHYSVEYAPDQQNKRLRIALLKDHKALIGEVHAFDGMQLFTAKKLPDQETEVFSILKNQGQKVKLKITWRAQVLPGTGQSLQVYNIIFKRILGMIDCKQIQRHYYCPTMAVDVPQHKLEVWPGYITAIAKYERSVLLMADMSHKILRSNTVLDIMQEIHSKAGSNYQQEMSRKLVGQIVLTRYNNKTYRIDDIDYKKNPMSRFETESRRFRREGAEGPTQVTFVDYYMTTHDLRIRDMSQPLLVTKPKKKDIRRGQTDLIYLVPELCTMTGLPDEMVADFNVMRDLAKHTRVGPDGRYKVLSQFIDRINRQEDVQRELNGWGLKFSRGLINIKGRILPPEEIFVHNNAQLRYDASRAEWDRELKGKRLIGTDPLRKWLFIYCGKRDEANANSFIAALIKVAQPMGFQIAGPKLVMANNPGTGAVLTSIRNEMHDDTQLVLVLMPSSKKEMYDSIKKQCCVDRPVPSQCILGKTIMRRDRVMSVATKVAIQMNMKLGGQAWCGRIPMKNCMIVGIDTYHDSAQRGKSVAALVASLDQQATKYFSKVVFQHQHEELHSYLTAMFMAAFKAFREFNGVMPDRIFIYRDGVGDGQIEIVYKHEFDQIKRAIEQCNFKPRVSMIVVQKRINTRLFGVSGQDSIGNPGPGTVVDDIVTKSEHFDFFLVSQSVRQGTVTPTHYIIIHDYSGLKPDQFQKLTYKLCHLYFNWPGTIRVPAPCQYAHKLAFLVGQSLHTEPSIRLCTKLFFL